MLPISVMKLNGLIQIVEQVESACGAMEIYPYGAWHARRGAEVES